jgi:hypothetical protein
MWARTCPIKTIDQGPATIVTKVVLSSSSTAWIAVVWGRTLVSDLGHHRGSPRGRGEWGGDGRMWFGGDPSSVEAEPESDGVWDIDGEQLGWAADDE